MRKEILLGLYVCASHTLGHSQSNTTQLPNGVIVHQAKGVESTPEKIEQIHIRTLEDWNLPECIEALSQVSIKLNEASESDREYYLSEKNKITKRINELKSSR
ncbi:MAG: hypothetical protein K0S23_2996 [Fluviicola sp.]|jgi:hypothetical protein|uniref:hypothetical protein n=1 Tax=Fluviicola sp. TaxID=1917219 RepID=UPI002631EED4|nr:hypothetical protein [Fluviicola sp.]MDF3028689.1 hypothetical protein [Fluviicola sp.]